MIVFRKKKAGCDLVGQRFGKLVVLKDSGKRSKGSGVIWLCKCDCGKTFETLGPGLKSGATKSCRCLRIHNLVGKKFGKLTVLRDSGERRKNAMLWTCLCSCGKLTNVRAICLSSGQTKSCGCLSREIGKERLGKANYNYKHGRQPKRLYSIWMNMKRRCNDSWHHAYKYYGGKGVSIYPGWQDDFVAFRRWALNNGYSESLVVDRIDSNGNYEPNNCQWITKSENSIKSYSERRLRDAKRKRGSETLEPNQTLNKRRIV